MLMQGKYGTGDFGVQMVGILLGNDEPIPGFLWLF
jgi:hypothetical protein